MFKDQILFLGGLCPNVLSFDEKQQCLTGISKEN